MKISNDKNLSKKIAAAKRVDDRNKDISAKDKKNQNKFSAANAISNNKVSDGRGQRQKESVLTIFKGFLTPYWIVFSAMLLVIMVLNLLARSESFCNSFTANVLPIFLGSYGRFSGLFPFSLGEIMLTLTIPIFLTALTLIILFFFLKGRSGFRKFFKYFFRSLLMTALSVWLIMTMNCSIPYGCSVLEVKKEQKTYSISELETLRNYLVEQCNTYAEQMPRTSTGKVKYDTSTSDIKKEARKVMQEMADQFPRLKGYYPDIKPISHSVLMSQSGTLGIYFPFSLEANYNTMMYKMNYPSTFCHEYSHLKGYMQEDESNFIAYLACLRSDDIYFQYSAYLSVLYYVNNEYYSNVYELDPERYKKQPAISDKVSDDSVFLTKEAKEEIDEKAVFNTETVNKISDDFTESYMTHYGIEDGLASYGRVTDLLLQYYDGILY
ncbi:MAG TPA: DUF3810 domain-containing protein [Lachnospiraceae bacterium]|nr:DUF3810 domain-containing protein [Lachnospiraceae bacterium]